MANTRVLIVGGGIAGLSMAITLTAADCDVHLIERTSEWTALGAGLTFNGATAKALKVIGVLDKVVAAGCAHGSTRVCDHQGRVLVEGSDEELYGEGIPVMGGILRPVLHAILRDAAAATGVSHATGISVERWEQTEDEVTAWFSDGSRRSFDLVIGADGLMSQTRQHFFPDAPKPRFTGQGGWRAVVPRPPGVRTSEIYFGGPHKAGINPVSRDEMYLFMLVNVPDNPWYDENDWPDLLRAALSDYGGHIGHLRDRLGPESRINYRPLETLVLPRPWHAGRVLMVGDAAHATTPHVGYGAGLAMEDAVVLAELIRAGGPVPHLLERFTNQRFARCEAIVKGSIELGELEMQCAPVPAQRQLSQKLFAMIREPAW